MNFKDDYFKMLEGKKVKRKDWQGFWKINAQTGKIEIHSKQGKVEELDLNLTITSTFAKDFEIV